MTREIKLRAWHKNWGSFANLTEDSDFMAGFNEEGRIYIVNNGYPDEKNRDFIIQQWTGLLDKNSKEIFEGDILQVDEYFDEDLESNLKKIGLVFFQNGSGRFKEAGYFIEIMLFRDGKFWRKDECELRKARWDDSGNHNTQPTTGWKIVGNKFENPELLEEIND